MASLGVSLNDSSETREAANDASIEEPGDPGSAPFEEKKDEETENKMPASTLSSKQGKRKQHYVPRIFQDSITVLIPINVRADLKIAIQKTRQKRIQSIQKRFPSLIKEAKKLQEDALSEDDDDDKKADPKKTEKEKQKPSLVPQREQYGSVLDYLEAKYVKGVMLGDEEEEESIGNASEGQGSVYSKGSFLDDTDLQRDVAEQVMANTTLTKLELEEDDADFFVNVGNLEVEDNDYGDHYDPLLDKDTQGTKKRKKSQSSSLSAPSKKAKTKKAEDGQDLAKTTKSTSSATSKKETKGASSADTEEPKDKDAAELNAKKHKAKIDNMYKRLVGMIKKMSPDELPRRKTKLKVALTCPANKNPGDDLTFTNPHNPDQRLRVKVPKDCAPGSTFKVTVPVKQPDESDNTADHNKFSKEFKDLLDDYARAYDVWCRAQADVDESFALFKEKQAKFDKVADAFPSALVTPVDSDYLKKVVRRVRQYKIKKKKADELRLQKGGASVSSSVAAKEESGQEDDPEKEEHRTVNIPTAGVEFMTKKFEIEDFAS
eukprot:scaffold168_cov124-Cylindrotheca_fusiformis.AAC.11